MSLTSRQLRALTRVMNNGRMTEFYDRASSYACVQGVKLPSFQEFFGLSSEEVGPTPSAFDEKTDQFLEKKAMELMEERRKAANVGRQ